MKSKVPWLLKCFNVYTLLLLLNLVNFSVYGIICAASVLILLNSIKNIIIFNGISCGLSLLLSINELHLSKVVATYFRFLCTFRGRGLTYILLALIIYQPSISFNLIATYFVTAVGILYVIVSFIQQLPPPNDIKGNWRSYQTYCDELYTTYCGSNISQAHIKTYAQADTIRVANPSAVQIGNQILLNGQYGQQVYSHLSNSKRKDDVELAMEINDALNNVQYSDFISSYEDLPSPKEPEKMMTFRNIEYF